MRQRGTRNVTTRTLCRFLQSDVASAYIVTANRLHEVLADFTDALDQAEPPHCAAASSKEGSTCAIGVVPVGIDVMCPSAWTCFCGQRTDYI
jgi:hypothetical protein